MIHLVISNILSKGYKKMNIQRTIEDLTQICIELRSVVESTKDEIEKEQIVSNHIKAYAESGLRVNDFAKGKVSKNEPTSQKETLTITKEDEALTEEEKKEYANYIEIKNTLELELLDFKKKFQQQDSIKEIMELLHEYNEIKDATQIILGALATMQGVTVARLHEEFDLPLKDE